MYIFLRCVICSAEAVLNNIWEHKKRSLGLLQGLLLHQGVPLGTAQSLWVHPYPCVEVGCLLSIHSEKGNSKKTGRGSLPFIISAITLTKHQLMVWMSRPRSLQRRWRARQGGTAKAEGNARREGRNGRAWLAAAALPLTRWDPVARGAFRRVIWDVMEGKTQGIFPVFRCKYCSADCFS